MDQYGYGWLSRQSSSQHLPSLPGPYEEFDYNAFSIDFSQLPRPEQGELVWTPTAVSPPIFSPIGSSAPTPAASSLQQFESGQHQQSLALQLMRVQGSQQQAHPEQQPLLDSNESAQFSSFLNELDGETGFLFNPVLPEGMPSPPAYSCAAIFESQQARAARESMRNAVNGMSLGDNDDTSVSRRFVDAANEAVEASDSHYDSGPPVASTSGDATATPPKRAREKSSAPRGGSKKARYNSPAVGRPRPADSEEDDGASTAREHVGTRHRRRNSAMSIDVARAHSPAVAIKKEQSLSPPPFNHSAQIGDGDDDELEYDDTKPSPDAGSNRKAPLSESQRRSNHIISEQRRRNAIRLGFKELVEYVLAGEKVSGISIAEGEELEAAASGKKTKGKGRGRGRKGDIGVGASKSVVLDKAAQYIMWLQRGNEALVDEVERMESIVQLARSHYAQ